tara:strand:- start:897 stop:1247 length:351 start_codon:yes stop_codon:yes gene_type:complete
MKYIASLMNAVLLVALGLWGYQAGGSATALIPVGFGVALLLLYPGVKKEAKVPAHIAVLLTLIVAVALLKPLSAAIERGDTGAIIRTLLMVVSSIAALVAFVKSFIAVRKARKAAE